MDKLLMCRICLVENVRMFVVSNKNLQDFYEILTNIPFVTEDNRPMLACYLCYAKLKQGCRFKRKCLEAEELFAQMLNRCEKNPVVNRGSSEFMGGLIRTSIEKISIIDDGIPKSGSIEVEVPIVQTMPATRDTQYEFIEVKVEHQTGDLEPEYLDNIHRDIDAVPVHQARSDSQDDVPLLRIKTEVEDVDEEISQVSRRRDYTDGTPATKTPKLEDKLTAEQKKTETQGIFQTIPNVTIRPVCQFEVPCAFKKPRVNNVINKKSDKNCNTSNKNVCKIKNIKLTDTVDVNKQETLTSKEKPFKCDVCNRRYTLKSHLTCHLRSHTGEKPYECDFCHRCFGNKSHLKCHILTHTGMSKHFKCDVCQRRFTLKNNLRTHLLVHTGEKPYKCHICQRAFTQKIHLRSHIPIHTGDRPYKCDTCERSFSLKHSLKRHIKTHSNKNATSKTQRVTRTKK